MSQAFVDTWAWVALVDKKDSDHEKAKSANKKLLDQGYSFVTTNFVFSETVTILRYRVSYAAAIKYRQMLNEMVDGGLVKLVRITEAHEKEAWQIFEKYNDQDFSYLITQMQNRGRSLLKGIQRKFIGENFCRS